MLRGVPDEPARDRFLYAASFEDGVLQLQGDQRERAAEWFATHGFRC